MSKVQRLGEILPAVMRDIQARMLEAESVCPYRILGNSNMLHNKDLITCFAGQKSIAYNISSKDSFQNLSE